MVPSKVVLLVNHSLPIDKRLKPIAKVIQAAVTRCSLLLLMLI